MITLAEGTNGALLEHARLRRALLDVLNDAGEVSLLTVHDRLRERGIALVDMRSAYGVALTLVASGLATSRYVDDSYGAPRRLYAITEEGRRERARLGVP